MKIIFEASFFTYFVALNNFKNASYNFHCGNFEFYSSMKKKILQKSSLRISFFIFFFSRASRKCFLSNIYSEEIKLLNNYIQFSSWSYFYLALFVRINISLLCPCLILSNFWFFYFISTTILLFYYWRLFFCGAWTRGKLNVE